MAEMDSPRSARASEHDGEGISGLRVPARTVSEYDRQVQAILDYRLELRELGRAGTNPKDAGLTSPRKLREEFYERYGSIDEYVAKHWDSERQSKYEGLITNPAREAEMLARARASLQHLGEFFKVWFTDVAMAAKAADAPPSDEKALFQNASYAEIVDAALYAESLARGAGEAELRARLEALEPAQLRERLLTEVALRSKEF